jgi:hypothetical protein
MAAPVPEDEGCGHPTKAQIAEEIACPEKGLAKITSIEDAGSLPALISTKAGVRTFLPSKIQPIPNIFYKF